MSKSLLLYNFFRKLGDHLGLETIYELCKYLRYENIMADTKIINLNEKATKIFILIKGNAIK